MDEPDNRNQKSKDKSPSVSPGSNTFPPVTADPSSHLHASDSSPPPYHPHAPTSLVSSSTSPPPSSTLPTSTSPTPAFSSSHAPASPPSQFVSFPRIPPDTSVSPHPSEPSETQEPQTPQWAEFLDEATEYQSETYPETGKRMYRLARGKKMMSQTLSWKRFREHSDILTIARMFMVVLLLVSAILSFGMAAPNSSGMSMKEFLDKSLLESLDGDIEEYSPGDVIVIEDRIWKIGSRGSGDSLYLVSIKNTDYQHMAVLLNGTLPLSLAPGDYVRLNFTVGESCDGIEYLRSVQPENVKEIEGGFWSWR